MTSGKKMNPADAEYMKRLNERKQAIRQNLKDKDPGRTNA